MGKRGRRVWGVVAAAAIGPALCPGCASSPEKVRKMVQAMEPPAVEAATERARTDLGCPTVQTAVLSRQHGKISTHYDLQRVVYRIQADGCRLRTTYSVACTPRAVCSAISESGMIERVQ